MSAGCAATVLLGLLVIAMPQARAVDGGGVAPSPAGTVHGSVAAGGRHTCGIRTNGTVACWGYRGRGATAPPGGQFSSITSGFDHSCGLRVTGGAVCWGDHDNGRASPPPGPFRGLSAGLAHTCGVKLDATLACWGYNGDGRASAPSGSFVQVSSGYDHSCAIRDVGTVACWGDNTSGKATPPTYTFMQVSAGATFTCGIGYDRTIACWGSTAAGLNNVPPGAFRQVAAGYATACAVRIDGAVVCWGSDVLGEAGPPSGTFLDVSMTYHHACAVRTVGTVVCWGADDHQQASPAAGTFSSRTVVAGGSVLSCGIGTSGKVVCWGTASQPGIPDGTFVQISVGNSHACGIRTSGALACWGDNPDGRASPPAGGFVDVSAGDTHSCGVTSTGAAACWGANPKGETIAEYGAFRSVATGSSHSCALRTNGLLVCWGDNSRQQTDEPAGTFVSIDGGSLASCGLRVTGTPECFGALTTHPSGLFTAVDADGLRACGIRADGTTSCWSASYADLPYVSGPVVQVSLAHSGSYVCAIRPDNTPFCTGDAYQGSPPMPAESLPTATVGQPYAADLRNRVSPTPVFTVTSGALPPGLHLSPDGTLSGAPKRTGTYSAVVSATNFFGSARASVAIPVLAYRTVIAGDIESVESDPSFPSFTVGLSQPVRSGTVKVHFAVIAGTAKADTDYDEATSGTLTWTPTSPPSYNVLLHVIDDTLKEGAETVRLVLSSPQGAVLDDPQAVLSIVDDDGYYHVATSDAAVHEGDGDGARLGFAVRLSEHPQAGQRISVRAATGNGTATAGTDYTTVSQTLTWTATDPLTKVVWVPVTGDNRAEADETVQLTLSRPAPAALTTLSDTQGRGIVTDDD